MKTAWISCWCYATGRSVLIRGEIVGRRTAELLQVEDCKHKDICNKRDSPDCLINKLLEGRWP